MTLTIKNVLAVLGLSSFLATAGAATPSPIHESPSSRVEAVDYTIPGADAGLKIFLRNKHDPEKNQFNASKTVLFVHGASQPAETVFDIAVGKGSWADTLVEDGFDVWLVDVRGYGRSGVPDDVAKAGENSAPFATTQQAVADIASAIDFIRTHRHVDSVNLIAWSWGTVITGSYAAAHVDAVQSLTLLGPVWPRSPSSTQPSSQLGPWAYWTFEDSLNKLQNGAPQNERANLFPAQDRDVWEKALLASQPAAAKSSPAKFRSPTGVVADAREYWGAGKLPYNPEDIRVPTFIVVGQWDAVTPPSGADALYLALKNSPLRSSLHIPRATHFVAVETGRDILIPAVQNFIAEASTAARLEGVRR